MMSIKWAEPKIEEYKHSEPPSIWISVIAFVVIYAVCLVVTVLNWKQGKPVICAEFFVRVLLVPLIVWGMICSLIYFGYEDWNERVDLFNNLCRRTYARWRWWAQERVAILGRVTLAPEKELAERMLGLEGSAPMNAGKILPLAIEKSNSASRVQQVLEQLVTPFAPYMQGIVGRHTFSIVVQSEREEDLNDLRALLRKLAPRDFDFVKITRVPQALDMGLIEGWLSDDGVPDFRLVLAYQLHAAGQEPTCSEAAVALLFASDTVIAGSRGKLKPEAWVFRPIPTTMDTAFDRLKTLLAAQQSPIERIKHLWLSHIPGQGKHATLTAVKDTELKLAVHDLDTAIGVPGPVNALLTQALAAQMVQHGQGTQLVATPYKGGIMLNLIGTSVAPVQGVAERLPTPLNVCSTLLVSGFLILLFLVFIDAQLSTGYFLGLLACFVAMLLLQVALSLVRNNQVADDFYRRLPW
jgi:hypothetical protein